MLRRSRAAPRALITLADRARGRAMDIAAQYYRKSLDLDPHNWAIWGQYGDALKESGRLAEAEAAYRRALADAPDARVSSPRVTRRGTRNNGRLLRGITAFAFVDGMHHCEVVLRDIANCARLSREGALIFVHDVLPENQLQVSREPGPGPWMGDVYKVVPTIWRFSAGFRRC